MIENKTISVVVLARNEEKNIRLVLEKIKLHTDEVIVVDGHSSDRTADIARELGAKVLKDSGKGKGDGIRTGIGKVTRDIIVFIDADGSHDADDIPELVKPIIEGKSDMVIGSRLAGGSDEFHGTVELFCRMVGSAILTLGVNLRFGVHLTDVENGFRAVRKDIIKILRLKENTHTIEQEMTIKALHKGFRLSEVPAHEYKRYSGESTISLKRDWFRFVYTWIRYLFFA